MGSFDPGNFDNYRTGICDTQYPNKSFRLADWLARSSTHKLVVLAGEVTAWGGHAGIQNYLFEDVKSYPEIGGRKIRQQVVVCNYDNMNHEDVWINFKNKMNDAPITLSTCPTAPGYEHVVSWNP